MITLKIPDRCDVIPLVLIGLWLIALVSPTIAGFIMRMAIASMLYFVTGIELSVDLIELGM